MFVFSSRRSSITHTTPSSPTMMVVMCAPVCGAVRFDFNFISHAASLAAAAPRVLRTAITSCTLTHTLHICELSHEEVASLARTANKKKFTEYVCTELNLRNRVRHARRPGITRITELSFNSLFGLKMIEVRVAFTSVGRTFDEICPATGNISRSLLVRCHASVVAREPVTLANFGMEIYAYQRPVVYMRVCGCMGVCARVCMQLIQIILLSVRRGQPIEYFLYCFYRKTTH